MGQSLKQLHDALKVHNEGAADNLIRLEKLVIDLGGQRAEKVPGPEGNGQPREFMSILDALNSEVNRSHELRDRMQVQLTRLQALVHGSGEDRADSVDRPATMTQRFA